MPRSIAEQCVADPERSCGPDKLATQRGARYLQGVGAPMPPGPHYGAAEPSNELAPPHSITSLATASRFGGMVSPSALVVLRLITSSNLVGIWMGSSAGFAPRSTRST